VPLTNGTYFEQMPEPNEPSILRASFGREKRRTVIAASQGVSLNSSAYPKDTADLESLKSNQQMTPGPQLKIIAANYDVKMSAMVPGFGEPDFNQPSED
jgi:hypothetical protein